MVRRNCCFSVLSMRMDGDGGGERCEDCVLMVGDAILFSWVVGFELTV